MGSHPNTTAAGLTGGAGTFLVYALHRWAHVDLNPAEAGGIVVALTAAVLWVGRRGIRGALHAIWNGTGK